MYIQLGIQREVARDIGAQVSEVNNLKGVVTDGDLSSTADILTHDVGLLQANDEAELCAGVHEAGYKPL